MLAPHAARPRPTAPAPAAARASADLGMLLVCLIWGINFSVTKGAFASFPPLPSRRSGSPSRACCWCCWSAGVEGAGRAAGRRRSRRLIVLGVVGNTLYQLAFISGLARTSATNSALILATVPTVVAVFAGRSGSSRSRPRMLAASLMATLGVVLVILADAAWALAAARLPATC